VKHQKTIVVFDNGKILETADWKSIYASYDRSIRQVDFPLGAGTLTLRQKECYYLNDGANKKKQWQRNGVIYLKDRFIENLVNVEKWKPESKIVIDNAPKQFTLYPSREIYKTEGGALGSFDFLTSGDDGCKAAIEWETGNISSSHRSLNKMCICLAKGAISVGVLIVSSRNLYAHLTDRIGNIAELNPYLSLWRMVGEKITKGALVISVIEHDALTTNPQFPYLNDGDAECDFRIARTSDQLELWPLDAGEAPPQAVHLVSA